MASEAPRRPATQPPIPTTEQSYSYLDESGMSRLRRNPGGWGIALGALVVLGSLFLVWIEVSNRTGDSERFRAVSSFTGQTLFFAVLLALIAGFAVIVASSGWRILWAVVALALGGLCVAAAGWAILDPSGFTTHAHEAQLLASLTTSAQVHDESLRLSQGLASGALTASARLGAFVGLAGGALIMLGALLSFRRPVAD
jgi:hypothetical protein